MAKAELRRSLDLFFRLLDISPIARNKPDVRAIRTVRHFLYGEKLVVMYPEGHRHRDGTVGEFREWSFLFRSQEMAPVIPVVIKGLENFSFNNFWNRHVKIAFGSDLPHGCNRHERRGNCKYGARKNSGVL